MNFSTKPIKGMRDFAPQEFAAREYIKTVVADTYKKYGFLQIETPVMEAIELLCSGQGGENEKMIFKILKRGEKLDLCSPIKNENDLVDYGMRFDLTLPLARFFAENKEKLPYPFKVIQIGSAWRAERNQKGRYRQLMQCDIDIIGSSSVTVETELIMVTSKALLNLGLKNFKVRINDRKILEALAEHCSFNPNSFGHIFVILDKLDKIGVDGVEEELTKASFSTSSIKKLINIIKEEKNRSDLSGIAALIPNIPSEIIDNLQFVIKNAVSEFENYEICFDLTLVRGMGYYTGQIFEIEVPEYKSSVGGGGRYDNMIGTFSKNNDIPACGFSIGFERISHILQDSILRSEGLRVAIIYNEDDKIYFRDLSKRSDILRKENKIVSLEIRQKNLKNQLKKLQIQGYTHFAIYNPGEEFDIKPF